MVLIFISTSSERNPHVDAIKSLPFICYRSLCTYCSLQSLVHCYDWYGNLFFWNVRSYLTSEPVLCFIELGFTASCAGWFPFSETLYPVSDKAPTVKQALVDHFQNYCWHVRPQCTWSRVSLLGLLLFSASAYNFLRGSGQANIYQCNWFTALNLFEKTLTRNVYGGIICLF